MVAAGAGDEDADGGAAGSPYFLRFFPKTGTVGLDEEDDAAGALVVAVAADVEAANGLLLNMEDALGEDDKLVVPVVVVFVVRTGLPSNRRPSPVNA